MTERIFITGDRMLAPMYPGMIAVEMLRAVNQGKRISTGTLPGVDSLVRVIAEEAGVDVEIVEHVTVPETGKPDFEQLYASLPDDMSVLIVHGDPMSSSVTKAALNVLDDERVRLMTPADLL